ncbi:MAG: chlorophyllide reductase iron protein subunit X, partial [Pseudomonadota bacterium]
RKSANYQIVGRPGETWAPLFETLAQRVAEAPPVHPSPLDQEGLLSLFSAEETGADFVLEPATAADMRGANLVEKPSLEVVYEEI